jgi:hypothetical protein
LKEDEIDEIIGIYCKYPVWIADDDNHEELFYHYSDLIDSWTLEAKSKKQDFITPQDEMLDYGFGRFVFTEEIPILVKEKLSPINNICLAAKR